MMKRRNKIACALLPTILSTLFGALNLCAQTTDPLVYTVGKVFPDADSGNKMAYILWQPGDPSATFGKYFAIYRKSGDATSPDPYQILGRTQLQTSPAATHALLKLGGRIDFNASSVANRINALYAEVTTQPGTQPAPPATPGLPEAKKLSHLLNIAATDIKVMQRLFFLGRAHPGVYMALGHGFAVKAATNSLDTYEVREVDALGVDLRVIGRVTLKEAAPTSLVATSRPYEVLHLPKASHQEVASPMDHLVTRLRWGMPTAHRRLLPHIFGYNLYRVKETEAANRGWNTSPPTAADMEMLIQSSSGNLNPDAKQVNSLPIMAADIMTEGEAANTGERETIFIHDDKNPPINPFKNGDTYYYFVAPRDIAGHPGPLSPGTRVVICDRLPPSIPMIESIRNIFASTTTAHLANLKGNQHFRIRIRQTPDLPVKDAATRYHIYRWNNHTEHMTKGGDPSAHLVGSIPHIPGQAYVDWDDSNISAPKITPADSSEFGKTWWYTVRAEDNAACNPKNLSGHSPPAFGVLRDRTGPSRPTGFLTRCRYVPLVNCDKSPLLQPKSNFDLDESFGGFVVQYKRIHQIISGFDMRIVDSSTSVIFFQTTRYFSILNTKNVIVPPIPDSDKNLILQTRARLSSGLISNWGSCPIGNLVGTSSHTRVFPVDLSVTERCFPIPDPDGGTPPPHDVIGPKGIIVGPLITATLPIGTAEYRIYRRVGPNGAYEMLDRGSADGLPSPLPGDVTFTDPAPPTVSGTSVCYFIQVFDENGNSGPRVKLGCLTIISGDLGTPMLADAEYLAANAGQAQVQLRWFCDPVGVERFEIWAAASAAADPELSSVLIGPKLDATPSAELNDEFEDLIFCGYQTKTITSGQIGSGAEFSVVLNVPSSQTITYIVRAVGKGTEDTVGSGVFTRSEGPYSNAVSGKWTTPPVGEQPIIPWPSLATPDITSISLPINQYQSGEGPLFGIPLPSGDSHSAAVLMGVFSSESRDNKKDDATILQSIDPMSIFFSLRNQNANLPPAGQQETVAPFVVYRHQVPNAAHPNAVPNLIQVSPLIDRLSYRKAIANGKDARLIVDPFLRFIPFGASEASTTYRVPIGGQFGRQSSTLSLGPAAQNAAALPYLENGNTLLWWIDPMPVTKGARYQYLIVHFTKRGEINRVIPTNYVDQP